MTTTSENRRRVHLEWRENVERLIQFYRERYVSRDDTYVGYYQDEEGAWSSARQDRPLSDRVLHDHVFGFNIIGTYTTNPENDTTKYLHIDIDAHDDEADPDANLRFANVVRQRLYAQGLKPVLMDSNGKGGYWVDVFFTNPVPAGFVRNYGLYLTRDYADHGVADPEVFPKQASVQGEFGNMTRLPGKHYKRKHWTKVAGRFWLEGQDAIDALVGAETSDGNLIPATEEQVRMKPAVPKTPRPSAKGKTPGADGRGKGEDAVLFLLNHPTTNPDLIPAEHRDIARPPRLVPPPAKPAAAAAGSAGDGTGKHQYAKLYGGDLSTLDLVGLFDSHGMLQGGRDAYPATVVCPWQEEHTTGKEVAYVWQEADDLTERGWPRFFCHHAHCSERKLPDVLAYFGAEKVDAHCARKYEPAAQYTDPEELAKVLGTAAPMEPDPPFAWVPRSEDPPPAGEAPPAAESPPPFDFEPYKQHAWTRFLWQGYHLKYLKDEDRKRRIASIHEVRNYIPATGFFAEYLKHWMPTTDAPVLFHAGAALAVAATMMHRRVWLRHGANQVRCGPLWIGLLAGSSKMRKSTCIRLAQNTLPVEYLDVLGPDNFTTASLLMHLGVQGKDKEELAQKVGVLRETLKNEPETRTGVCLLGVDELGNMLGNLKRDYNAGGKQLLTTLYGRDFHSTTKKEGCCSVIDPVLNILAASTLEWLSGSSSEDDKEGGFYPRWLFLFAEKSDYVLSLPDPEGDRSALDKAVTGLQFYLQRQPDKGEAQRPPSREKRLAEDAERYYHEWHERMTSNAPEEMGSWIHRMVIDALKIALLYEVTTTDGAEVSLDNVQRACGLIDRLVRDTARLLKDHLAFGEEDKLAKLVKAFLREKGQVSLAQLHRRFHRPGAKRLDAALATLTAGGYVMEGPAGPRGGKHYVWQGEDGA
jgi:hypothetical protein